MTRVLETLSKIIDGSANAREADRTDHYASLFIQYGYARLGREFACCDCELYQYSDPIHDYLFTSIRERIEQARNCEPPYSPLSQATSLKLESLSDTSRYKVDRLREQSPILAADKLVNAFGRRLARPHESVGPTVERERYPFLKNSRQLNKEERLLLVLNMITQKPCRDSLVAMSELEPDQIDTVIDRVLYLTDRLPGSEGDLGLASYAMLIAALNHRQDAALRVLESLERAMLCCEELATLQVCSDVFKSLRMMNLCVRAHEFSLIIPDTNTLIQRLLLAAVKTWACDSDSDDVLSQAITRIPCEERPWELARVIAYAVSHSSAELSERNLMKLAVLYSFMQDRFSTRSHFLLSKLSLVESVVLAVVDSRVSFPEKAKCHAVFDMSCVRLD